MSSEVDYNNSAARLIDDIKTFIRISLAEDQISIEKWASKVFSPVENFCHNKMQCTETDCAAYKSDCGRCWLQVGTMCEGEVQGKFADKFELCTECQVYREYVGDDPVRNLRELILTLIHSLNARKQELETAQDEIKTLRGLIPICSSCKKILGDQGLWNKIESYLSKHSETEFIHSYCNDCIIKLHPELTGEIIAEEDSPHHKH